MRKLKTLLVLILIISCKNSTNKLNNLSNGIYCAEVDYNNPKTKANRNYNLSVEIRDKSLVKIYFTNGGWLDDSHFIPPCFSNKKAFFTDDKGRVFNIKILEKGKCYD
ncbi:hypothetical protein [Polaribacter atrinae]|uniref:hypothetical protein n=1 Tax=Polaribacter atrinae TaxID=1333662 RepID=UPI0030FA3D09